MSTSAAVLAGFAFSGLAMSLEYTDEQSQNRETFRTLFTISSTCCVALNLITLCAATFASLYSVRLALRGDGDAVEKSVKSVRGEYKFVLFLFCLGIFAFFMSIALMGFYKFHPTEAAAMATIGVLGMICVGFLVRRASTKFYLSKRQRYQSTKNMKDATKAATAHTGANQIILPEEGIPYTRMNGGGINGGGINGGAPQSASDRGITYNSHPSGSERHRKSSARGSLFGGLFGGGGGNKDSGGEGPGQGEVVEKADGLNV
jgi:hypothetical protein